MYRVADGLYLFHTLLCSKTVESGKYFTEQVDHTIGGKILTERREPHEIAKQYRRFRNPIGNDRLAASHTIDNLSRQDVQE